MSEGSNQEATAFDVRAALESVRALNLSIELELEAQRVRSGAYDPPESTTTHQSRHQAAKVLQQASDLLRRLGGAGQGDSPDNVGTAPPGITTQAGAGGFTSATGSATALDPDSRVPRCPHCGSSRIIDWVDRSEGRLVLLIVNRSDEAFIDAVDTQNIIEGATGGTGYLCCDACDSPVSVDEL